MTPFHHDAFQSEKMGTPDITGVESKSEEEIVFEGDWKTPKKPINMVNEIISPGLSTSLSGRVQGGSHSGINRSPNETGSQGSNHYSALQEDDDETERGNDEGEGEDQEDPNQDFHRAGSE